MLSEDICAGDILEIDDDQILPADCLLIDSQGQDGTCFVDQAMLDGEKNLKIKSSFSLIKKHLE